MNEALYELIFDRVSEAPDEVADLVLAACEGTLESVLEGGAPARPAASGAEEERPGVYLRSIEVTGFRGIGPTARLDVRPGPGLTLVVGRNGSGKSSFAEGLEYLLTGENRRWSGRSSVWRDGWRNLHHEGPGRVSGEFHVEGRPAATTAWMEWAPGCALEAGERHAQEAGRPRGRLEDLGWEQALRNFRPFLSYSELGTVIGDKPSQLYDHLSSILGLDDLVEAQSALKEAVKARKQFDKEAAARLKDQVLPRLEQSPDERARACLQALKRRPWKLDEVEARIGGGGDGDGRGLADLARVTVPEDLPQRAARLRAAEERLREACGADALQAAALLEEALRFHSAHGDGDCPVCRRPGALDSGWREASEAEVRRLRARAEEAREADREHRAARAAARAPVEADLRGLLEGVDLPEARRALEEHRLWTEAGPDLAAHIEARGPAWVAALSEAVAAAGREHERRESEWRELAVLLASWLETARAAREAEPVVERLERAEKWLKEAQARIRDERFEPLGKAARDNWEALRCDSNVELGTVRLEGASNQRRVALDVTVDGVGGAALSVMSQGEINSLALSLFLPRATLQESPFRFLLIDDPVQAMDPARVDGLARVLARTGLDRQVLVFTHDNRLPESVRRLGIAADIVEVTRRPGSRVELRRVLDPAARCLDDARALALTDDLDADVAGSVVPGFCREAVEAALTDLVRRRRLARGERHGEVEELLERCTTLNKLAALALCEDMERVKEAYAAVERLGRVEVFRALNKGAHHGHDGDLLQFVRDTEALVRELARS